MLVMESVCWNMVGLPIALLLPLLLGIPLEKRADAFEELCRNLPVDPDLVLDLPRTLDPLLLMDKLTGMLLLL